MSANQEGIAVMCVTHRHSLHRVLLHPHSLHRVLLFVIGFRPSGSLSPYLESLAPESAATGTTTATVAGESSVTGNCVFVVVEAVVVVAVVVVVIVVVADVFVIVVLS